MGFEEFKAQFEGAKGRLTKLLICCAPNTAGQHGRARTTPRFVPSHLSTFGVLRVALAWRHPCTVWKDPSVTPKPRYRRTHPDHQPPESVQDAEV